MDMSVEDFHWGGQLRGRQRMRCSIGDLTNTSRQHMTPSEIGVATMGISQRADAGKFMVTGRRVGIVIRRLLERTFSI